MPRLATHGRPRRWLLGVAVFAAASSALGAPQISPAVDAVWENSLRAHYFQARPIIESDEVIELDAPPRAEDAALVPLRIKAHIPQTSERYIKTISLVIDKNPGPLAGRFHFTPRSGRADLALRVRVNEYTPIRAIAETNDGQLYMTRRFVKASGGCSAPGGADLAAAMSRLGKMKLKLQEDAALGEPQATQLGISHPNLTGMQMDQLSRMYTPAHFVKSLKVTFNGTPVFSAETDISVSENPNFRFYFVPAEPGTLAAEVEDSKGMKFSHSMEFTPTAQAQVQK
ncbi:MAG: quinoprotein dehydrogenase-associated SoxYZ-like carrier [Gammaproteobacteria bacterium]|nr:quinoprotein dehydrogenase-associated SoxYZ-like carrier [Gammaproteobacteria bacterium]